MSVAGAGGGSAEPRRALVAARDAALRTRAFDVLAALGFRVDAVGDELAVGRRLAKDRYELVVTDDLVVPEADGMRIVTVEPTIDAKSLARAVDDQ